MHTHIRFANSIVPTVSRSGFPSQIMFSENKGSEENDRCRDSVEAILTNGLKCVGRGILKY